MRTEANTVFVWQARVSELMLRPDIADCLDPLERQRAGRFRLDADRRRSTAATVLRRHALAHHLNMPAHALTFERDAAGKPRLVHQRGHVDLRFNLTHSGDVVLLAVASGREVGIDVEACRSERPSSRIAARFFSAAENAALRNLPTSKQTRAFYTTWTRKEAFVKARGGGLSLPLNAFTVNVDPDEPAHFLSADPPLDVRGWTVHDLPVASGYAAALVVEGSVGMVRHCDWRMLSWPRVHLTIG